MDLVELLGTDYKDGMSVEEINTALKDKKIADLSTGKYVLKEMTDAKKREADSTIKDLQEQLNSKLTDDEKKAKEFEDKEKEIQELKEQIKKSNLATNKAKIIASTSEMIGKLDIKEDDKDFNSFIDLITLEDAKNSEIVGSYLGKILKGAYEKGVNDTTKKQIANNNSIQTGASTNTKEENFGSKLAKRRNEIYKQQNGKSNYFNN